MADLARRSRDVRKREEATKADAEAAGKWRKLEELRKTDPAEAARLANLSIEDVARAASAPDPLEQTRAEVAALKADAEALRSESAQREAAQVVTHWRGVIAKHVEERADDFPLTHELGEAGRVFDLMAELHRDNVAVTWEEAAAEIESTLSEQEKAVDRARERRTKKAAAAAAAAEKNPARPATGNSGSEQTRAAGPAPTISSRMNGEPANKPAPTRYDSARHRAEVLERFTRAGQ